jgi:hypothetical protein
MLAAPLRRPGGVKEQRDEERPDDDWNSRVGKAVPVLARSAAGCGNSGSGLPEK